MNSHLFKKPYILARDPHHPERSYELGPAGLSVGRLPENDVCLGDQASSRRHCRIEANGAGFRVVDLASANGTRLNGIRITEHPLQHGDIILIGKVELEFIDPQSLSGKVALPTPDRPARGPVSESLLFHQLSRLLISGLDLKTLLNTSLDLLAEHFETHRAGLVRMDRQSETLEIEAQRFHDPVVEMACAAVAKNVAKRAIQEKKPLLTFDAQNDPRFSNDDSIAQAGVRSAMCAPLFVSERTYGAIYLDRLDAKRTFSDSDLDILSTAGNMLSCAIATHETRDALERETRMRSSLSRFHSPDVVQTILRKTFSEGALQREVARVYATVLFSDIKGFTSMSERLTPEEIAVLLNNYLSKMTQVIFFHGGTVNKFIGDAVMAIFGAPLSHGRCDDATAAIRAGMEMQRTLGQFLTQIAPHKRFQIRIGINSGDVVAGYIGAEGHLEYTVLGDPVNLASRLETRCPPGSILVGESTYALTKDAFEFGPRQENEVKGKEGPVGMYEVTSR